MCQNILTKLDGYRQFVVGPIFCLKDTNFSIWEVCYHIDIKGVSLIFTDSQRGIDSEFMLHLLRSSQSSNCRKPSEFSAEKGRRVWQTWGDSHFCWQVFSFTMVNPKTLLF